ncbi:hypothetical protein CgunFtcFv8_009064 [Champsocephalus gunnari]|uniref:Abl-interactor homeo-domain homologous domain-containing protein n=1 Tax=Champsocephalus gunnari TaxID=52237 RepID=A0AAN8D6Q3_CHAGU|nr:hypothetical protein CgunFtcFv8_009064 [Champsocephalus gunnari]
MSAVVSDRGRWRCTKRKFPAERSASSRRRGESRALTRSCRRYWLLDQSPAPPYSRRPISYQQLDGIGHGIKVSGNQAERAALSRSSSRSSKAPVQCPVAPPVSGSSFGRPVAPPTLPTPPAPPRE